MKKISFNSLLKFIENSIAVIVNGDLGYIDVLDDIEKQPHIFIEGVNLDYAHFDYHLKESDIDFIEYNSTEKHYIIHKNDDTIVLQLLKIIG